MISDIEALRKRISNLSDEDLLKMVRIDYASYHQEAIDIANEEIKKRNLQNISNDIIDEIIREPPVQVPMAGGLGKEIAWLCFAAFIVGPICIGGILAGGSGINHWNIIGTISAVILTFLWPWINSKKLHMPSDWMPQLVRRFVVLNFIVAVVYFILSIYAFDYAVSAVVESPEIEKGILITFLYSVLVVFGTVGMMRRARWTVPFALIISTIFIFLTIWNLLVIFFARKVGETYMLSAMIGVVLGSMGRIVHPILFGSFTWFNREFFSGKNRTTSGKREKGTPLLKMSATDG